MLQGERISNTGSILFKTQTTDHQSSDHKKLLFTELKKLTNASDGNLSIQLKEIRKLGIC